MLRALLILVALAVNPTQGRADTTGLDLLRGCREAIRLADGIRVEGDAILRAAQCMGYLSAFLDFNQVVIAVRGPEAAFFCSPPSGIQTEQVTRVVHKWLSENPKDLHMPARMNVLIALHKAYPCAKPR